MPDIPRAVLSEHFQERMNGYRLVSALFLTYQFDPEFFEQEVLPVFLDVPLSHVAQIRLVQLEDALRLVPGEIAVYYDANGLVAGDLAPKLDVRRVPVQHTAIFHPKNVFLLVEKQVEDGVPEGLPSRKLIVASMSANLTKSGWWGNVEACHVEEIEEGAKTHLKNDLTKFLRRVAKCTPAVERHATIDSILDFLSSAEARMQRSVAGKFLTRFYAGPEPFVAFLEEAAGNLLRGCRLEVISPYFDAAGCRPLRELAQALGLAEVRVLLPRSDQGQVACSPELYDAVRDVGAKWGRLPKDILARGKSELAAERFVHAKLYRFFDPAEKREIVFVGSLNLTWPAHGRGGNLESGYLVDACPSKTPEFWLSVDAQRPLEFRPRGEGETEVDTPGSRLNLRYRWDRETAEAFWDAADPSPELLLRARGVEVASLPRLLPGSWKELASETAAAICQHLLEGPLFTVEGEGAVPAQLLVQEEGMIHRPSLFLTLAVTDILRYWALLTPAQRSEFIELHAPELVLTGLGAHLIARHLRLSTQDGLFDRFAEIYHAFACLERGVRAAIENERFKDARERLFGCKYDSLGTLLERLGGQAAPETALATETEPVRDDVQDYVILMCATQLVREIRKAFPDFWQQHRDDGRKLEERLTNLSAIRQRLSTAAEGDLEPFLGWFDQWFLPRAKVVEPETNS